MRFVCTVELHVTVNNNNTGYCTIALLRELYDPGNNKTYLGHHINFLYKLNLEFINRFS